MIFSVKPAHRLEAERQRDHVEQQPVVVALAIAGERVRLDRRAERDDFVRIEIGERRLAEELGDRAPDLRHARRAADQHDALDVGGRRARHRAARACTGCSVFGDEVARDLGERLGVERQRRPRRRRQRRDDRRGRRGRSAFSFASRDFTSSRRASAGDSGGSFAGLDDPAEHAMIEVVAAERRVAVGREHLEHAARQLAGSRCRTCRRRGRRPRRRLRPRCRGRTRSPPPSARSAGAARAVRRAAPRPSSPAAARRRSTPAR